VSNAIGWLAGLATVSAIVLAVAGPAGASDGSKRKPVAFSP
jgi:hypothetical protein